MIPLIGTPRISELEMPQGADPVDALFPLDPNALESADSAWMTGMGPHGPMDTSQPSGYGTSTSSTNDSSQAHRLDGSGDGRSAQTTRGDDAESGTRNAHSADDASRSREGAGNEATTEKLSTNDHARFQQTLRNAHKAGLKNGVDNLMEGLDERAMDQLRKAGANRRKSSGDTTSAERMSGIAKRVKQANLGGDAQKTAAVTAVTGIARALSEQGQGAERPVSIDSFGSIAMSGEGGARSQAAKAVDASTANSTRAGAQARFEELLAQVKETNSGESVLRVQDKDAGELEVRVSTNGQDLIVRVHAQDVTLRERMLESLAALEQALTAEGLVEGRVDVAEDNLARSSDGQAETEDGENDAPIKSPPENRPFPTTQDFNEPTGGLANGRFHVVA